MGIKMLIGLLLIASIMIGSVPTAMADDQDQIREVLQDGSCLDCTCICSPECTCDSPYCTCPCCS